MTNAEEIATNIFVTIDYGEVAGLKGGKSQKFETNQIVIFKDHLPEIEILSNCLQYPKYVAGDTAMDEDERDNLRLEYLHLLLANAREEINHRKELRELERKKDEADKLKQAALTLDKHFPPTKIKKEQSE